MVLVILLTGDEVSGIHSHYYNIKEKQTISMLNNIGLRKQQLQIVTLNCSY